jgi:hypothetical protein
VGAGARPKSGAAHRHGECLIFEWRSAYGRPVKLLKNGYCSALIGQRPYAMGVKSMDVLNDLSEGKKVENINTGVDVVDSSNVDQFIK